MGYFTTKNTKCIDEEFNQLLKTNPLIRLQLVDNICENISVCLKVKAEKGFDKIFLSSNNITYTDVKFKDLLENEGVLKSGCVIMVDSDLEANEGINYLVKKWKLDNLYKIIGAIYQYNANRTLKNLKHVLNILQQNVSYLKYNQISMLRNLIDKSIVQVADSNLVVDIIEILDRCMPNSSWNCNTSKKNIFI